MHSTIKHLNKSIPQYCKKCILQAYKQSNEEYTDIELSINKAHVLEDELVCKLHKISSIIEESNHLVN